VEIVATKPYEQDSIAQFLAEAFRVSPDAPFLDRRLLGWKYFRPRAEFLGARSFTVRHDGRISAHVGIWPIAFHTAGGPTVSSLHLIDWGASPEAPGAGAYLYKELAGSAETAIVIGGSEQGQRMLSKLGFRRSGVLGLFGRVIRPWRQYHTRPGGSLLGNTLRFGRNALWRMTDGTDARGWVTIALEDTGGTLRRILDTRRSANLCLPERSVEMLAYIAECPTAQVEVFLLLNRGAERGYCVLSRVHSQTRIADLWIDARDDRDWAFAYAAAARAAAADERVVEVIAGASDPCISEALLRSGFRKRAEKPVFRSDPGGKLDCSVALRLSLLESDGFFLHDTDYPYLT
jgi:hypothetical protein